MLVAVTSAVTAGPVFADHAGDAKVISCEAPENSGGNNSGASLASDTQTELTPPAPDPHTGASFGAGGEGDPCFVTPPTFH